MTHVKLPRVLLPFVVLLWNGCGVTPPAPPPELAPLPHRVEPELRRMEASQALSWTEWEAFSRAAAPEVRAAAWRTLARRGHVFDTEGKDAELIERAFAEEDSRVAVEVSFALPRSGAVGARRWLLAGMDHEDGRVRAGSARGLAHLGGVAPWGPLLRNLAEDEHPMAVSDAATALLAWIGIRAEERPEIPMRLKERIVHLLLARIGDPEEIPYVRWRCLHALSEMSEPWPDAEIVVAAYSTTFDQVDLIRFHAARLYARLTQHPAALEAVWGLGRDRDPRTAAVACGLLKGKIDGNNFRAYRRSLEWGLSRLEKRKWDRARREAYVNLLAEDPQARYVIRLALEKETSSTVRAAAFRALHRIDPEALRPEREEFLASDDWVLREGATLALGDLSDDAEFARALELRRADSSALVREAALRVMFEQRARLSDGFVPEIRRALSEGSLGEVGTVGEQLKKIRDANEEAPIEDLREDLVAARERFAGIQGMEVVPLLCDLLGTEAPDFRDIPFTPIDTSLFDVEWRRRVTLVTAKGELLLELDGKNAPRTSANWIRLVESGELIGLPIHRVVPGFVVQGCDPLGDGWGSGGVRLPNEISPQVYGAGIFGVPDAGLDTGGSQIFWALHPWPHLEGRYTRFGRLLDGGDDVLIELERGDTILEARVEPWPAPPKAGEGDGG